MEDVEELIQGETENCIPELHQFNYNIKYLINYKFN